MNAAFQGDGLQIERLNLSPAGWELPSRRDAKACLEAVRATAGECQAKVLSSAPVCVSLSGWL